MSRLDEYMKGLKKGASVDIGLKSERDWLRYHKDTNRFVRTIWKPKSPPIGKYITEAEVKRLIKKKWL